MTEHNITKGAVIHVLNNYFLDMSKVFRESDLDDSMAWELQREYVKAVSKVFDDAERYEALESIIIEDFISDLTEVIRRDG